MAVAINTTSAPPPVRMAPFQLPPRRRLSGIDPARVAAAAYRRAVATLEAADNSDPDTIEALGGVVDRAFSALESAPITSVPGALAVMKCALAYEEGCGLFDDHFPAAVIRRALTVIAKALGEPLS